MKHFKIHQKYSAAYGIFDSLLNISSGDETLHLMLDISLTLLPTLGIVAYPEDLSPSNSSVILLANAWRYPLASFSSLTLKIYLKIQVVMIITPLSPNIYKQILQTVLYKFP